MTTAAILALLVIAPSAFGAIEFQEEYAKQIKAADTIEPLTDGLFGDSVSLYNGNVTFSVTDVSLPGNNALPVSAARKFAVESRGEGAKRFLFGDWDLDIPYISGVYQQGQSWQVQLPSGASFLRCSGPADYTQMAPPGIASAGQGSPAWKAEEFWIPPSLYIPGKGSNPILAANAALPQPANESVPAKWATKDRDYLYCVPLAAGSGGQGEGFRVRTPDGLTYTFNHLVASVYGALSHRTGAQAGRIAPREEVRLYPTSVKDRFGNVVNYSWNGRQLQSIADAGANGRLLSFSYNADGTIRTVSDQSRTWTYTYVGQTLTSVTLPDASQWQYNLATIQAGNVLYKDPLANDPAPSPETCERLFDFSTTLPNSRTATITHPSGARGIFTFNAQRHGRTNVTKECQQPDDNTRTWYSLTPRQFDTLSLMTKQIEGPGVIGNYQWRYKYYEAGQDAGSYAVAGQTCTGTCLYKDVTVQQPDHTNVVHRFGKAMGINEGQLLGTTVYDSAGVVVRSQTFTYVDAGTAATPFPASFGLTPYNTRTELFSATQIHPQSARVTSQDGANFSWTAEQFDTFGRPTQTTKAGVNNAGPNLERIVYHDNTALWVLGQVQSVTYYPDATNQREVSGKSYSSMAQVASESSFGKVQKIYTYNTDGTIATVSDATGAAHATALSDYHRGIPRLVTYADGTKERATVTNLGQLDSVTDEMGYTTSFLYWPDGKLKTMTPPASDVTSWLPTNYTFEKVASDEYGLAAGHWRRTVTTGSRNKVVYYDLLLRPVLSREWDSATPANVTFNATAFDSNNRPVVVSTPMEGLPNDDFFSLSTGTHTTYDAIGRPLTVSVDSEIGPLVTSYQYLTGFQRKITNPRNYSTTSTFLAYDEPTYDFPKLITGEDGVTTTISRHRWGQPGVISRAGPYGGSNLSTNRKFTYDANMRLCKTIDPEGGNTIIDYDLAGNIAWTAPAGSNLATSICQRENIVAADKTTRTYDLRNRLLSTTYPSGTNGVSQTYWDDGALRTLSSGGTTWTYEYNKRRLLEKETLNISGDAKTFVIDWAYDALGAPRQLVYPDGTVVDYAPDAFGRPTQVGAYASNVQYFLNGAIKNFTYANGIQHTLTQHPLRLTPKRSSDKLGSAAIVDFEYGYDANGNVDVITDYTPGETLGSKAMSYDKFDRLVSASSIAWNGPASFVYDPLDNLRRMQAGVTIYDYTIDANNRLSSFTTNSANAQALAYDVNGNVTSKGSQTFTFDKANRLLNATAAPGNTGNETYQYDGNGRRVSIQKSGSTAKRYAVYSQGGQLLQETDVDGYPTNYVYLGGTLVARGSLSAPPLPVPATPIGFIANPNPSSTGNYLVSWNSMPNATKYVLQERPQFGAWTPVHNAAATQLSVTGKSNGIWEYQVKACNAVDACSNWSSTLQVTVSTIPPLPAPNPIFVEDDPAFPGIYNRFRIRWTQVAGATSHRLLEELSTGWTIIASGPTLTSWVTPNPRADNTYRFKAQACNNNGTNCTDSDVVAKTVTTIIIIPLPPTPVSVAPNPSQDGNYVLQWGASANTTYYKVGTVANGQDQGYVDVGPALSWSPATAVANGTYKHTVLACNSQRCSAPSASVTETVARPNIPVAPLDITTTATGCSGNQSRDFTIRWPLSTGATSYRLRQTTTPDTPEQFFTYAQPSSGSTVDASFTRGRINGDPQTRYYYEVQACNDFGCSGWRGTAEVCVGTSSRSVEAVTTVTYYHTDALGSPVKETDSTGMVVKTSRYEPYGAPAAGNYENGPGYTGHATDSLTRLDYMQQRYYDPQMGRFLSIDPVRMDPGNGANFNRYWYAGDNPYKYIDPDGRAVTLSGSDENKKDFRSISFRMTGYKLKESGGRLEIDGKRDKSVGSAIAADALKGAIAAKGVINVNLVRDDKNTLMDDFPSSRFDNGDIEVATKISFDFGAALYAHILVERTVALDHGPDDDGFDAGHAKGSEVENSIMGAYRRNLIKNNQAWAPNTFEYFDKNGNIVKTFSVMNIESGGLVEKKIVKPPAGFE